MVIDESIYEGVVEPFFRKLLGNNPYMLVVAQIWESEPPHQREIKICIAALASARKSVYTIQEACLH